VNGLTSVFAPPHFADCCFYGCSSDILAVHCHRFGGLITPHYSEASLHLFSICFWVITGIVITLIAHKFEAISGKAKKLIEHK